MALEIKHVADLMGMHFRIPSYQRGYRWERKHIVRLLDDLLEYSNNLKEAIKKDRGTSTRINEDSMGFFCLQPLAITPIDINGETIYDVIDGQQRLTTIFLILHYFINNNRNNFPYDGDEKLDDKMYLLTYEIQRNSSINEIVTGEKAGWQNHIDSYFIFKGYKIIEEWFKSHTNAAQSLHKLLLPSDYDAAQPNENDKALHDVRFIWYEVTSSPDSSQSSINSIAIFNNLNYGKIGLNACELIKALLFQCDTYDIGKHEIAKKDALSRSTKWSLMEDELQDKNFWGMLSPNEDSELHLELILKFVAEDIDKAMRYSEDKKLDKKDSEWIFNIFNYAICDNDFKDYAHTKQNNITDLLSRIEYIWNEILKVYGVLSNWYNNRELYHKIGLLIYLLSKKEKQLDVFRELYKKYKDSTKTTFDKYLSQQIGEHVKITSKKEIPGEKAKINKTLEELRYIEPDDYNDIRRILLLHNVQLTIENSSEKSRFPFYEAPKLNSLEHIHPQHLDLDEIKFDDLKKWFDTRKAILKKINKTDLKKAIKELEENLKDENTYISNKSQCIADLDIMDQYFDELAHIDPDTLHSLKNMALVDTPTNSALSNNLIDKKRQILKDLQKEHYIPIGTWNAFNKFYSDDVGDLKYWRESDRDAYFADVKRVYELYIK